MAQVQYDQGVPSVAPEAAPANDYLHVEATPADFGGQVAQAGEKLGQAAIQTGQFYDNMTADDANQKYLQRSQEILHGTDTVGPDGKTQHTPGFFELQGEDRLNAAPHVKEQLTDLYNEIKGNLYNDRSKYMFDQVSRRYLALTSGEIGSSTDQAVRDYGIQTNTKMIETAKNQVANAEASGNQGMLADAQNNLRTAYANISSLRGLGQAGIAAANLDGDRAAAVARIGVHLDGLNPDLTKAQQVFDQNKATLAGTPEFDTISQTIANRQYTQEIRAQNAELRAERVQDHQAAIGRVNLDKTFSAASAIVDSGQPATTALSTLTDAQIDSAFPRNPEQAQIVKEQVADLRTTSGYIDKLNGATPDQMTRLIQEAPKPDPNDPATYRSRERTLSSLTTAVDRTVKALHSDPVNYVLGGHPDIANEAQGAMSDPTKFNTYATHILGVQGQMGLDPTNQRVLTEPMARSLVDQITADPGSAQAKIQQLQQTFGEHWNTAWHDLTTLGKLPAAYQTVGALDDPRDAALLSRAIGEQSKANKEWPDILGPKPVADIKTAVRSDPAIISYASSLAKSGASIGQVDSILSGVDTLAYAKSFYDHSPTAAQDAVRSLAGKYDFTLPGGPRVPSNVSDVVTQNAQTTLERLSLDKLAVPSLFTSGPKSPDENFAQNKAWAKPSDSGYLTHLPPDQEAKFQEWTKANNVPFDPGPKADYDMRGFYQALQSGNPIAKTAINPNDNQIHFPDYWKTPYHHSFSNESQWAQPGAPQWNDKDQLVTPSGNVVFDERAKPINGAPSQDDYLRTLRADPVWITSPKSDALWLVDQGGRIVREKDGQPVAVPFNQSLIQERRNNDALYHAGVGTGFNPANP